MKKMPENFTVLALSASALAVCLLQACSGGGMSASIHLAGGFGATGAWCRSRAGLGANRSSGVTMGSGRAGGGGSGGSASAPCTPAYHSRM